MISSKIRRALFNDAAWKKAEGVLAEILEGNASSPPGVSFVYHQLDANGNPKKDKNGLQLYNHTFGTHSEECYHTHIRIVYHGWVMGIEMATYLLNEHRHRYTQNVSQRRHPQFPFIGHYDTWKVDRLQALVERNRRTVLYPGWTNSSD
jgi:hypothetical protein